MRGIVIQKNHGLKKGSPYIIDTGNETHYYFLKKVIDKDTVQYGAMNIFQIARYKLKSLAKKLQWKMSRIYYILIQ